MEEQLKKLEKQLKKCEKERDEYLDGWQRAKADFVNARKDDEKNQEEFRKFAHLVIICDILPVLDSFDLAMQNSKDKSLYLIKSQLDGIIKKYGLTVIKAVGEKFNPEFHESIEEVESEKESSIIIEEIQKGFLLHEKVLRPSKVKISK
ncbi:nucleotide exchange factor GrpE [Patescibacteria group bacterium]